MLSSASHMERNERWNSVSLTMTRSTPLAMCPRVMSRTPKCQFGCPAKLRRWSAISGRTTSVPKYCTAWPPASIDSRNPFIQIMDPQEASQMLDTSPESMKWWSAATVLRVLSIDDPGPDRPPASPHLLCAYTCSKRSITSFGSDSAVHPCSGHMAPSAHTMHAPVVALHFAHIGGQCRMTGRCGGGGSHFCGTCTSTILICGGAGGGGGGHFAGTCT